MWILTKWGKFQNNNLWKQISICHWCTNKPLKNLKWISSVDVRVGSVGFNTYLNAFLGPLSAVHHGCEGERGDETAQEVLNTQAQDSHTWERKHTRAKSLQKYKTEVFLKKAEIFTLLSAVLHFSLCCSV